jgi:hypothetical protein
MAEKKPVMENTEQKTAKRRDHQKKNLLTFSLACTLAAPSKFPISRT